MPADQHTLGVLAHKRTVARFIQYGIEDLYVEAITHDDSKFSDEEYDLYAQVTPKLKHLTFGSEEYKEAVREMAPAVKHHVEHNRHHPDGHEHGVEDMTLIDLFAMVCDWYAASLRPPMNDIKASLPGSFRHFKIDLQLARIIENTVGRLGAHECAEGSQR